MQHPWGPAPSVPLDRVQWRIDGKPSGQGDQARARYVPYIDSREAASLLDEWVGPTNWRDIYEPTTIAGKEAMFCHIEIRANARHSSGAEMAPVSHHPDDVWIRHTDIGSVTGFEQQKGTVSDAFKRCASIKWGVGRNVYDLPGDIWAPVKLVGEKAYPAPGAQAVILSELKKRGFDVTAGGQVEAHSSDTDTVGQVDTITADQITQLVGVFDAITDKDSRKNVKARFVRRWGKPPELPVDKFMEALSSARKLVKEATDGETGEDTATVDEEGEGPAAGPPERTPVPDADGVAGEVAYTRAEYEQGISQLEDSLTDTAAPLWADWWSANIAADRDLADLTDAELAGTWAALKAIVDGTES